ncbi:hypothetical protein [Dyadobacter sp. CY312]|uniref:hypothetical protein n=1 Tax=Dyadobacter sp. CY312 TaxID=2907303 RepID=UPI001F2CC899|nr:hypothetical protein [Dyadobacter sp. CY312]
MQKYKRPKFTEEALGINPFSVPLVISLVEKEFKNQYRKQGDLLLPVTQGGV